MQLRRAHHLPWWARVVGALLLVAGVALMHTVVAGPATTMPAHAMHDGQTVPPAMASQTQDPDTQMGDGDHCDLGHHCTFVRGDDVPLPPVILVVLIWILVAPLVLRDLWPAVVQRLGRPPPWAVPTHLELAVIRC
ncbi:hypothetical protein GYA93_05020 [Gordonia desulfuricans]|uniref:Uncharacterized protein n=1 Tax=Gordonia desulfuricans TaxID=89051 RepID=A0A7K3LL04_9ACTN|nr:DUF6153 family protein [Gordonia desulfuricans]NDK88942.1 hypothetical protein [Gordonia desulfuricans]